MTRFKSLTVAFMAASFLVACTMAPTYQRPEAPIGKFWPEHAQTAEQGVPASGIGWTQFALDARLQALIAAAIENNRDLRIATLRIDEARALYNIQWSERLPNIDAQAHATRLRTARDMVSPEAQYQRNYQVGLGMAAFEIDFFGRVRSLSDAALYQYFATEEAQRSAHISLVSEVCKTYLTERALTRQRDLAQKYFDAYRHSYMLMEKRFEVGASSALELRQSETLMHNARVAVATLERQRSQMENALAVLVGAQTVENLPPAKDFADGDLLMDIPAGLPSDLLTYRPDIRQYENQLRSANANIGAARAAFFPRITLTAIGGTVSNTLAGLFDPGSAAWTFTPQLLLPIFDAGRNIANLDLAHTRTNIAVAQYEAAIQNAFRETADALIARGLLNEQVDAQAAVLLAESERVRLSQARFENGIASSLEVLDAQRQQFSAEQALIQVRLDRLINAVDLYRSLGGGLTQSTVPPAADTPAPAPLIPAAGAMAP